jgi:hypothetical protein
MSIEDDIGPAPPDPSATMQPSMGEIQRRAVAKQAADDLATTDPVAAALGPAPPTQSALRTSYGKLPVNGDGGSLWGQAASALKANLQQAYETANKPVLDPASIESPFREGTIQGARSAVDWAAEKLARGGEALVGQGALQSVPGYRSAQDIRGDIAQRQKAYETNPANDPESAGAMIGRGLGTGVVLGGPLMRAGEAAGALLGATGATSVPWVARALDYLGGGARAAKEASLPVKLATAGGSLAAQGGALGGAQAAIESDPSKPFLPQVAEGAASGAVAAPLVGGALSTAAYPFRAALGRLPGMIKDPEVVNLADRFVNQYGIKLDPTQLTENPTFKIMTDQAGKLPFSGAGNRIAEARLQWQQSLASLMGEQADNGITHSVMKSAAGRIGPGIGAIADRTVIPADPDMVLGLHNLRQEMGQFSLSPEQTAAINKQIDNVGKAFVDGGGKITGKGYQNIVQTDGPLDDLINRNDPTLHGFGMKIKDIVDGSFQRAAAPGDQEALRQLRSQYRVMKTVQPLVEQKGLTGDIDPNGLLQRVRSQSAKFDSANGGIAYTGGGKLGDLAYGGQIFFGKQPDSGTAARNIIMGGVMSGGVGGAFVNPTIPAGIAAGLTANRLAQGVLRSPYVGSSMIENSLRPPGPWVQNVTPYAVPGLLGEVNRNR